MSNRLSACEPSAEAIQAAEDESRRHGGSVKGHGENMVHYCNCGASWPDKQPRGDGDDAWGLHVTEMSLRAAYVIDRGLTLDRFDAAMADWRRYGHSDAWLFLQLTGKLGTRP